METTRNFLLPLLMPSQAQKHVTHNEALTLLDCIVQLAVLDRDLFAPPAEPTEGDRYLVGPAAIGDWLGGEDQVAVFQDGVWLLLAPRTGWLVFVADEGAFVYWDGTACAGLGGSALQNLSRIGLATAADATNPLSAKLNNALFSATTAAEGGDGDLRFKLNKEGAADTVSQFYQSGFSGRAETGLAGSDDFSIKVSPDGTAWREAMVVDRATGKVRFPNTNLLADYGVNLFQDSGRFAGGVNGVSVGGFAFPAYLTLFNGAAAAGHGKFIINNSDYGGSGGSLNPEVRQLVDKIRDPGFRQFGLEFWVARVTAGAGTGTSVAHLSRTFYLSTSTALTARAPKMTLHAYVRALDDDILVRWTSDRTILKDGVAQPGHVQITPAEGWVSITVVEEAAPRTFFGYNPAILGVYAPASGDEWLIACPALLGGWCASTTTPASLPASTAGRRERVAKSQSDRVCVSGGGNARPILRGRPPGSICRQLQLLRPLTPARSRPN